MDIRDVEVFRAGTHTDSAGRLRTYTHSDLARIAGSYNPSLHEAPAVIGHPATNAPAWGWVSRLAVAGDRLLADFRQVAPEFAQLLREGRFKKRLVSLFPDLRLRHVGFLGAAAPAVAGLKDVAFSGGESALEYSFEHAGADPHNLLEDEVIKTLLEKLQADVASLRTDLGQLKDAGQVASFSQRLAGICPCARAENCPRRIREPHRLRLGSPAWMMAYASGLARTCAGPGARQRGGTSIRQRRYGHPGHGRESVAGAWNKSGWLLRPSFDWARAGKKSGVEPTELPLALHSLTQFRV